MEGFRNSSKVFFALILLMVLVGPVLAQPLYTITPIRPLPGDTRSTAIAINESGRIAVISFNETYQGVFYTEWPPFPDTTLGFVWDKGRLTPLLLPTGYQGSWAYGLHNMNANGQVVGTAAMVDPDLPSPPDWNGHPVLVGKVPVLWDKKGKPRILALPEGYTEGSAWAINNRG